MLNFYLLQTELQAEMVLWKRPPPDASELLGWRVKEQSTGNTVGVIDEVLLINEEPDGSPHLRVRGGPGGGDASAAEVHLIPFVQAMVPWIEPAHKAVLVTLPRGFLALGRQRALLERLRPELQKYVVRKPGGVTEVVYMPTRRQLEAAGRADLVRDIQQAGGFLEVATLLGLRSRRRPIGYWDNADNLDQEMSHFVMAHWTQLTDPATDQVYYYNQVTAKVQWDAPTPPLKIPLDDQGDYMIIEDEQERVMPSRSTIMAAGRYDLHHAIMYHGGYRLAAETLDRRHAWPRFKDLMDDFSALEAALYSFASEGDAPPGAGPVLPTITELLDAGRNDLLGGILHHGGLHAVAERLGWQTQRRARCYWHDMDVAAQALRRWIDKEQGTDAEYLPTHQQLREAGRHDLRYALQTHGSIAIAEKLRLRVRRAGRPRCADS
ncbi:hypothetical protein WJX72_010952 [[Myrmecia] bisecta]|uniref:WW domain-containing protein n=1 Tax=[Myrmecia] bisecta TaxID=41462 RepID=A0AAW1PI75_9CHLO